MENVAVAAAALPRAGAAVLDRSLLWEGGVVSIRVPRLSQCRTGRFKETEYLQFPRLVKGGVINLFVHSPNPAKCAGKTIKARVRVFRKDLSDGRSFLYVDLLPAPKEPVTHRLIIESSALPPSHPRKIVFQAIAPEPLAGSVVITTAEPEGAPRVN